MTKKLVGEGCTAFLAAKDMNTDACVSTQTNQSACLLNSGSDADKTIDPARDEGTGLFVPRLTWIPLD